MGNDSKFELPRHIERYLAASSKLCEQDGNRVLQEIIVDAQIRIHEEWSRDNLNGGTYAGHGWTRNASAKIPMSRNAINALSRI